MKLKLKNNNTLLSIFAAFIIGGLVIALMGYNPIEAYSRLLTGAFKGKLNLGTTLQLFTPLFLTAIAFAVSAKVNVFNVGVEGELILGALAAAWVGYRFAGLPSILHITLALSFGMLVGALWALIPGYLKAYIGVNEVTVTILMNYVATYLASYMVSGPMSGRSSSPRTPEVLDSAKISRLLSPSRANAGIFIAIVAFIGIYYVLYRTTFGYKIRSVGLNAYFSDYIGIPSKKFMVTGMMLSGAFGGLAGGIESLGVYRYFLDSFSYGIAFDGMLISLISKNDLKKIPFMAFFIAVLKSGSLGLERLTNIPKSSIDMIISIFIFLAAMEGLFNIFKFKSKNKKTNDHNPMQEVEG
ncbi:ABC transporter permease [Clostridium formicaceticum]|uniref:ABC transporter permease n=1 Tax=Clostridium formicaceticum TaxID=1497 RepID=A0AAC9RHA2_9CLOT|nr:ABC transporter permease [Clostridium formicaceticum]AOY76558.1 ABC transporter permease [Clostridium formicaceticum]ARE86976.1 Branched-chain amino acid transport system / permease component [Clostridium formicaceticum]